MPRARLHLHRVALAALMAACAAGKDRPPPRARAPSASPAGTAAPAASPDASPPRAALHHEVRVTVLPADERVEVEDAVTLSPDLRARTGDTVSFALHAGLSPERVGTGAPISPSARCPPLPPNAEETGEEGTRVAVECFAITLAPDERTFRVRYGGRVFHPVAELSGEEYARKTSYSPGLVSSEGAFLSGATRWLPQLGDELVTFTLEARVPAGWDAVSQGARTRRERDEQGTVARWESPEPQEEAFLVAGPFFERSRRSGRVLVQTFLRSDDPALAGEYLTVGEQYLSMYERLLGPYPYAKFAVVENFWETGYGMPSFTLLGSRILRFPFILHSSYPHEILHNWWGNGVFVDLARGNWSEGLTAYLADHLVEEQRGRGAEYRRTSLQRYADHVAERHDLAVREFRARHGAVTQAVGYDKVLMIFHMLRQRLGDERFVAGLRRFYEDRRFRPASFGDLTRAMSAVAGEDLAPWFEQWVDRPGAPAVRLESAKARPGDGSHALELTLSQVQAGPRYEVDLPVYLTMPSRPQPVKRSLRLVERRQRFVLAVDEPPTRVDVDPEFDVFRRLDPAELPPALSGAFGATRRVIVLPSEAPAALRTAYEALAESWRAGGTEIVTDSKLARLPAGKAVWILGWENRLRPAVTDGLKAYGGALSADDLRVGTAVLSRHAHTVVVAIRSPADAAQVVAFVGAEDAQALPGLGRKLPHYGKYSVLGFEGDEPSNVVKDTWPVLASPMSARIAGGDGAPARAALPPRRALAVLPPPRPAPP